MQCARFFWLWMMKFCLFRRRNAIKSQITIHPIKAAGEAGTKCCPHERGHYGHCTGWEQISATCRQTSYSLCTYRSSFQGGCGLFLFDTFLFYSQTYYKRIHDFHYGRTWDFSGALFLRLSPPALQGARAAIPVLKLFNQISRLEGI